MLPTFPSRIVAALLGVAFTASGAVFALKTLHAPGRASNGPSQLTSQSASDVPVQPPGISADDEPREVPLAERTVSPHPPAVVKAVNRVSALGQRGNQTRPEPSDYTRQLVAGLTNLDLSRGPLTPEQADQWKKTLQSLAAQGSAAIPAIREFLDLNRDLSLDTTGGTNLLGQTSLRSAFIDALSQIGGPEGTAALLQTLQSTTLPSEIAQLAQILEQQAPGQYRVQTLSAVNDLLNMASNGQLPADWDVGTLFKALQTYGDSSAASALEQLQGQWKYYATMTLAEMPDGQGVPALVQQIQDTSAGGKRDFAFQMLAQVATQYADAGAALLEQARASQISDNAWLKIAMGLAGDQYQIGGPPPGSTSADAPPGLKTYHMSSGNQNFYSLPLSAGAQIQERIALIDQLLAANPSPAAVQALQQARASLSAYN